MPKQESEEQIRESALDSKEKIIAYFMDKYRLDNTETQPSPINVKQFYITQVIKDMQQIEDPVNQDILELLITNSSGKVH